MTRTPSFLAREEWKTMPWSAGTTTKNPLDYLLDLAIEIPALLSLSDELLASQKPNGERDEAMTKQRALWDGVADLTNRFLDWKRDWVDTYRRGTIEEIPAEPSDQFPIFQCLNPATGATLTPTKLTYPDIFLAQTMLTYYAIRLILSSVDSRADGVSPLEQYDLACRICRSLEWYISNGPGNMINRMAMEMHVLTTPGETFSRFAFPVRVAWEVFPEGGPERGFIREVFELARKRLWESNKPSSSAVESHG